jgi:hypothetical protein
LEINENLLDYDARGLISLSIISYRNQEIHLSVMTRYKSRQLHKNSLISTVSEGDLGQISTLMVDCGVIEFYIILPLMVFFILI